MGLARLRLVEIRLRLLHSSFGWWVPREKSLAVSLVKHVAKLVHLLGTGVSYIKCLGYFYLE